MNEEVMNPETSGMFVNENMKADLLTSAKWAKFLCIMGCIGVGIMFIAAIAMSTLGSFMKPAIPNGEFLGLVYMVIACIYIYPLVKGFQFANGVKAACLNNNENELARGFDGLRSLLTFMGILTIIIMVIYVLIFLFAIIVGATAASHSF